MENLWLAMVLMALLSVACFFLTRRIVQGWHPRLLDAAAVVIVLLIGAYVRWVWGQLWIVRWIPLASVIVLANWFPLLLGTLAGVLWERTREQPVWRRFPAQLILIAGAVWSEIYVIPRNPPVCRDEWVERSPGVPFRICLQTTPHTCSAAAAATILTSLGLSATEATMAELCLTQEGTTWLGLYHGLTIGLQDTGFRAEFFECSVEELNHAVAGRPALLCCRLDDDVAAAFPVYADDRGWIPGISHSTVLLKHAGDVYVIGDPSQRGPEFWSEDDLANLWTGTGLRIVPEQSSNAN